MSLEGFVRWAEGLNRSIGNIVSWMALGTVLVCFSTVYTRYALNTNFTWLQDLYVWQHAAVIVLGAGYTMVIGGFVRVDIFYSKWSPRRRALSDLIQTVVFLVPFMAVCAWAFWIMVANSWAADEASPNPGGLQNYWILKGTLLAFVALVLLQAAAMVARSILVLRGREDFAPAASSH
ncbi:MAG: TRAP transporter small permease subunit [Rhodobacteraceae bacterium]|nr:TRAP transporter small permease subunit [Paracoccaceae bacterium]MCZ8335605.1 TRAP transporter small permease subunit [Paracoccaceae bacterium]